MLEANAKTCASKMKNLDDFKIKDSVLVKYKGNKNKVIIPNSVISIEESAFYGCSNLTSIVIPNSVTSIGTRAFMNCYRLVEIYNLSNINIKKGSFEDGFLGKYVKVIHTSLEEKSNLIEKDNYVFIKDSKNEFYLVSYKGQDKELVLPNDMEGNKYEINQGAFYECSSLTSIEIPNSIISIGESAFKDCDNLKTIDIPIGVTNIGKDAFRRCSDLTNIVIPNSVTSIGESAFEFCSSLTSIVIPNSVTSIGNDAFHRCSSLTNIEIPNSVTNIGNNIFWGCESLKEIKLYKHQKNMINVDKHVKLIFLD